MNSIKTILVFFVLSLPSCTNAQNVIAIEKQTNEELTAILNSIELIESNKGKEIAIRIYEMGGSPGSAGFDSGEVSSDLYIAVSEYDEVPNQSLFRIRSFYNPTINELIDNGDFYVMKVNSGPHDTRVETTFKITINEMIIKK